MRNRLIQTVSLGVVTSLLVTGCILSRGVDRAYLGMTVTHPTYEHRKTTGLILIPISFALDVVTFPLQALLLVIFGDNFPYKDRSSLEASVLNDNPRFQKLPRERKALALAELKELLQSQAVSMNTALVLCEDGHWVPVKINDEQRTQLLTRALSATPKTLATCHKPGLSFPNPNS